MEALHLIELIVLRNHGGQEGVFGEVLNLDSDEVAPFLEGLHFVLHFLRTCYSKEPAVGRCEPLGSSGIGHVEDVGGRHGFGRDDV